MKIAITKGSLFIPPTYFAINHAERMVSEHEFEAFVLAGLITEKNLRTPIHQAVPFGKLLGFRQREMLFPLFLSLMARQVERFNPDVIHQHFATWAGPAIRASRRTGAGMVTTIHGGDVHLLSNEAKTAMAKRNRKSVHSSFRHSSRVLAVSHYLAMLAIQQGLDEKKVRIHYQGVDTDYFAPSPAFETGIEPTVLFVGGHSIAKGARDVFEASVTVHKSAGHKLVMVGAGPLVPELRERAKGHAHIDVVGQMPRDEIRSLMQRATVVMTASQHYAGWSEAAGLVNLEAQACGAPVVGYRSGGIPEMVSEQGSVLVPERDQGALSDALAHVLSLGGNEYFAMRSAAREFAVRERSLAGSCAELDSHYREIA